MRVGYGPLSLEIPAGFRDQSTVQLVRELPSKTAKQEGAPAVSMTLNYDQVGRAPSPLLYLKGKLTQLKPRLASFREELCEETEVGTYKAARAQFSFVAELQLTELVLVWFVGDDLFTAALTTTGDVQEAWTLLRSFASSVRRQ